MRRRSSLSLAAASQALPPEAPDSSSAGTLFPIAGTTPAHGAFANKGYANMRANMEGDTHVAAENSASIDTQRPDEH